jgi:hypothetical protein
MKISTVNLKRIVDEVVKEEVLKTSDLQGPYTVHVKKGRLAGQTVMANKHKVTGVYYYLNPDSGSDEPLGTETDVEVQKQQDEGVGYVYAKDRAKDPKSIPGEHWRVKFQSSSDLKKHGNTEKSKIEEALFSSKEEEKKKEDKAKRTAAEIFIKFNHWDFVNALKQTANNIQRAAGLMALWGVTGTKTRPIHQTMSILFSSENRRIYTYLYMLCKQEIQEIIDLNRKTMQKESVSKKDIKSVIRELVDEMWADVGNISGGNDETLPGDDTQFGGEKKLKPTGRITEPGADEDLVNLYKGNGGQSDTSALPSVGGAMSEIQDLMEGKHTMNKKTFLRNLIRETIEEVRDEERIKEPQEQKNMRILLRIQSYAKWGINNAQKQPKKMLDIFNRIIMESDALARLQKRGAFDLGKKGAASLKTIETYSHYGVNNLQSSPDKIISILQRIVKQVTELIDEYTQGFPSNIGQPIYEISYESPSVAVSPFAPDAATHTQQEKQEIFILKKIQNYAHWGLIHAKNRPIDEIVGMFKKITDEIDGLVKAHEKGKEVSPSNVHEVAPPGWEGTVKAMKKHSVGGAKKWNPKNKKEEGMGVKEEAKKKITNPYALAWWMKNQGYKSHK